MSAPRKTRQLAMQHPVAVREDWETPPAFFAALDAEFHFTLDVLAVLDALPSSRPASGRDDEALRKAAAHVLAMLDSFAPHGFSNGVTDSTGSLDEGEVSTTAALAALRAAISAPAPEGVETCRVCKAGPEAFAHHTPLMPHRHPFTPVADAEEETLAGTLYEQIEATISDASAEIYARIRTENDRGAAAGLVTLSGHLVAAARALAQLYALAAPRSGAALSPTPPAEAP